MTANRPTRFPASGICAASGVGAALLLLCSCVGPVQAPVAPPPAPMLPPPPNRQLPTSSDWHDMPATAGVWQWSREGNASIARFGGPQDVAVLSLACNPLAGTVTVARADPGGKAATMSIRTTSLSRTLVAQPAVNDVGTTMISMILPAHDPLLDAMAFSRGRFAVEVPGLAPLYLPSWPEVGRVIEDCR